LEFQDVESSTSKFDLTLIVKETSRGLVAYAEYSTDLFQDETIGRLLEHFENLIKGVAENPDKRLSELPLLSPGEFNQLVIEWNRTTTEYPRESCVHELFEAQTRKSPDATAVIFGSKSLTYAELNNRANQLAHFLRQFPVGPDVPVAICVERSVEM